MDKKIFESNLVLIDTIREVLSLRAELAIGKIEEIGEGAIDIDNLTNKDIKNLIEMGKEHGKVEMIIDIGEILNSMEKSIRDELEKTGDIFEWLEEE